MRKGIIYKMDVFDVTGKMLTAIQIKKQLDWIIQDAETHLGTVSVLYNIGDQSKFCSKWITRLNTLSVLYSKECSISVSDDVRYFLTEDYSEAQKMVPAITGTERVTWAKARADYFTDGVNKDSLDIVERAIFFVSACLVNE